MPNIELVGDILVCHDIINMLDPTSKHSQVLSTNTTQQHTEIRCESKL